MTSTGKDALSNLLFASSDCTLVNLKLMRGDSQDISTQELRNEVHSALMQVRTGTSTVHSDFPDVSSPLHVDLEELAASY